MSTDHAATVRAMYDAFGRGDVEAILAHVAEDAEWEPWPDNHGQRAGVALLAARRGHAGVAEFFATCATMQYHAFEVHDLMTGGDKVGVTLRICATPPGGQRFDDEIMHLFTFDAAGKVRAFRQYVDTAKQLACMGLPLCG